MTVSSTGNKFAMLEMKMIIAHTLRRFSIRSVPKPDQFAMDFKTTFKPKGGVLVELTPRS